MRARRFVRSILPVKKDAFCANLSETSSRRAFFRERFSQLRRGSGQLAKSIGLPRRRCCREKPSRKLRHAVAPFRFVVAIKPRLLESMKRPPYSPLLALRNARRTGRMSERGNCFPFLRKVNGPFVEITLQFRRLMEAAMPGVADDDVRTPVGYPRDFTGTVTHKGDLISYAIDLSARRQNSASGCSARPLGSWGHRQHSVKLFQIQNRAVGKKNPLSAEIRTSKNERYSSK